MKYTTVASTTYFTYVEPPPLRAIYELELQRKVVPGVVDKLVLFHSYTLFWSQVGDYIPVDHSGDLWQIVKITVLDYWPDG